MSFGPHHFWNKEKRCNSHYQTTQSTYVTTPTNSYKNGQNDAPTKNNFFQKKPTLPNSQIQKMTSSRMSMNKKDSTLPYDDYQISKVSPNLRKWDACGVLLCLDHHEDDTAALTRSTSQRVVSKGNPWKNVVAKGGHQRTRS